MANKHDRLKEQVEKWREGAAAAPSRSGTTREADAEREKTLRECADDVEKILDDHTKD